jgi:hypothetical protein
MQAMSAHLAAGLALLVACASFGTASAQTDVEVAPGVLRVGTVDHIGLTEGSGLAGSRRFPGVAWAHNDGGYQFLFAIDRSGKVLGAFQVVGANLIDWEAVAADDDGNLYLADIGTNGLARTHVAVHRVKEPRPSDRWGNATVTKTWYLRFPGAQYDCESFFVYDGYGYLISKTRELGQVTMFRYPLSSGGSSVLLEQVTPISLTASATDASITSDGQRLGIVTSEGVYLFFINGNPASVDFSKREFTPFQNDFMEGGTFFEGGFLTSAETGELWLFTNANFICTTPPGLTTALVNTSVLPEGSTQFEVVATGCPPPSFVWRRDGVVIPGQTEATLVLEDIIPADAGLYEVTVSNIFGSLTSSATLTVRTRPNVRITEVMPSRALDASVPTGDWWELTSFESQPVDISGWRFNDGIGGLTDPFVLGQGFIIAPGETIVLAEDLTLAAFQAWWGETNLPTGLRVIPFTGLGLSLSQFGDTLYLWDAISTRLDETVDQLTFPAADVGVSFIYDPSTGQFGKSQLGVNGVVRAAASSDIGSPGRISAPAAPLAASIPSVRSALAGGKIRINFETVAGRRYSLEERADFNAGTWVPTGDIFEATDNLGSFFEVEPASACRFYRVKVD